MPTIEPGCSRGFSLIELIVVIIVLGILAGLSTTFIVKPVEAYLAAKHRAELVDIADTALLRIARDVRLAVPNSVRKTTNAGRTYLEYLPVSSGGRYRVVQDNTKTCVSGPDDNASTAAAGCNILDFASLDASFDVMGTPVNASAGQFLVVYNTGDTGTDFDVWLGHNRRSVTSNGSVSRLVFVADPSLPLPGDSPAHRFFLADAPVTYVCDASAGTIKRYTGYPPQVGQPNDVAGSPLSGATPALLAGQVSDCSFTYAAGATQRLGQLTLSIQLQSAGSAGVEQIRLYREVEVNNEP